MTHSTPAPASTLAMSLLCIAAFIAAPAQAVDSTVQIGVFSLFRPTELLLASPAHEVLLVSGASETMILESGQFAELRLVGHAVRCVTSTKTLVASSIQAFNRDGADLILAVPGRIERRFRGELQVSAGADTLIAVVTMGLEVAVASVVAAESPPGAPLEALKAQAVVARSYYVTARGRHSNSGFGFCDTTHCQFIREAHGPGPSPRRGPVDPATQAAAETRGLVLAFRGRKFAALYSASCGGRTRSLAEVGMSSDVYPYFAVECPYCRRHAPDWQTHLDRDEASALLAKESEQARLLTERKAGWNSVPGNNYDAVVEGNVVVLRGRGAGHGVGLCQAGAAAMASAGSDFRTILAYYYLNTTLIVAEAD